MAKYNIGLLLILNLLGCMQSSNKTEKKITASGRQAVLSDKDSMPAESIFHLTDSFQTQENIPFTLSMLKGKPTVVGMIFTHCTYACPRLTADIKNIADSLKGEKEKVNFFAGKF